MRSDNTTTVANWCASNVVGVKAAVGLAAAPGFLACSVTLATCLCTGC